MKKRASPYEYVSCYQEHELLDGDLSGALVIILRTSGCSWAHEQGCLMCGYSEDSYDGEVPSRGLIDQFDSAMQKFNDQKIVKIFNSGSFLDDREIPADVRKHILNTLADKNVRIVIESRPQFISAETLEEIKAITNNIEIAIGLETASDEVSGLCINKGSLFGDYETAARLIKKHGLKVRTYLLLKPPFLTEVEAIDDVWRSIEKIKDISDVISINPVNVQKGTLVERMWQKNQYRPPWLWSLLDILKRTGNWDSHDSRPMIISTPSGAGTKRGIHNCLKCDKTILEAVSSFSYTQDLEHIDRVFENKCECYERWLDLLELEPNTFSATGRLSYY